MAKDTKFDDIFDDTSASKKAPAKKAKKKAAAKKAAPKKAAAAKPDANGFEIDRFEALNAALTGHHQEALQRKEREDRYLFWSSTVSVAVLLTAFAVLYQAEGGWFGRVLLKLLFCGGIAASAFFAANVIEENRQKLRDLMGVVVKINEHLGFFEAGTYDNSGESFYPNHYKFSGSDSEDESNMKSLFVKGVAVFAILVLLIFV